MHTLVLNNEGVVFSWGCNDDSALGRGGSENYPERVVLPEAVTDICAGDSHSIAYN